jgi:hypothetical protein
MSNDYHQIGVTEPGGEHSQDLVTILHDGPTEVPAAPASVTAEQAPPPARRKGRAWVARIALVLVILVAGAFAAGFITKSSGLSRAKSLIGRQRTALAASAASERSLRGQVAGLDGKVGDAEKSVGKCQSAVKLDQQFRKAIDDMLAAFQANDRAAAMAAARRADTVYDRMNAANTICLDQPGPEASTV